MKIAFVCVWTGDRYGPEYVAILRDMVMRNASTMQHECAWFCVTDRPDELPEGVYPIPADPEFPGYWQKVRLFSPDMPWEEGQRVVYFDLDVAIVGRLEDLVERKGIIKDWMWPGYNSSVMVWDHGEFPQIWSDFSADIMSRSPGPIVPSHVLPAGEPNGGDQEWIAEVSTWPLFPDDWCLSYRLHARVWPPTGSKVICFNGRPKPHEFGEDGWARG